MVRAVGFFTYIRVSLTIIYDTIVGYARLTLSLRIVSIKLLFRFQKKGEEFRSFSESLKRKIFNNYFSLKVHPTSCIALLLLKDSLSEGLFFFFFLYKTLAILYFI